MKFQLKGEIVENIIYVNTVSSTSFHIQIVSFNALFLVKSLQKPNCNNLILEWGVILILGPDFSQFKRNKLIKKNLMCDVLMTSFL